MGTWWNVRCIMNDSNCFPTFTMWQQLLYSFCNNGEMKLLWRKFPYEKSVQSEECVARMFINITLWWLLKCVFPRFSFVRRHLLEKLDDRIFWRFFFSTVGGWIKKNTLTLTKARKEWKFFLLFIDWNTPCATTNRLWELQYYLTRLVSLLLWHCALEKACCAVASLCSGPETGLARWVRIKKQ